MALEINELKKKLYSRVNELPTLPVVVPKILQMIEESKTDIKRISEIIAYDPSLTSKILKVANSSYYGFSKKISELDRAVTLLGFNMVKSLALSLGVINTFADNEKENLFSETGLWYHSVAVATLMKEIAHTYLKDKNRQHLFVTGLLHDLGKLVFDQYFTDLFKQAITDVANSTTYSLAESEQKIIGVDHGDAGAILLERWNFPTQITLPIKHHHHKLISTEVDSIDLAVLRIADALCQEFFYDSLDDVPDPQIDEADKQLIGLEDKDIEYLKEFLKKNSGNITSFFQSINPI